MLGTFSSMMDQLLGHGRPPRVAVAVSGGSDSLCLFYHMVGWCKLHNIALRPLVVDHGLRPESGAEAQGVAQELEKLGGLPARILQGPRFPGGGGVACWARHYRYHLLSAAAHEEGIRHVFLGHQQDDLMETFLMRAQGGSTWRGLGGMSAAITRRGIVWLRPLLPHGRQELMAFLRAKGLSWVRDPTNQDLRFSRPRWRLEVAALSWPQRGHLLQQMEHYAQKRQQEYQDLSPYLGLLHQGLGYIRCPLAVLHGPAPRILSFLGGMLYALGGDSSRLRAWSLERALRVTLQPRAKGLSGPQTLLTLGGCVWTIYEDALFLTPEPPRGQGKARGFQGYGRLYHEQKPAALPGWWNACYLQHNALPQQKGLWDVNIARPWLRHLWQKASPQDFSQGNYRYFPQGPVAAPFIWLPPA